MFAVIVMTIFALGLYLAIEYLPQIKLNRFTSDTVIISEPDEIENLENTWSWLDRASHSMNVYKNDLKLMLKGAFIDIQSHSLENDPGKIAHDRTYQIMAMLNLEDCFDYPSKYKRNAINTAWDKSLHPARIMKKLDTVCPMVDEVMVEMNLYKCFPNNYDPIKVKEVLNKNIL